MKPCHRFGLTSGIPHKHASCWEIADLYLCIFFRNDEPDCRVLGCFFLLFFLFYSSVKMAVVPMRYPLPPPFLPPSLLLVQPWGLEQITSDIKHMAAVRMHKRWRWRWGEKRKKKKAAHLSTSAPSLHLTSLSASLAACRCLRIFRKRDAKAGNSFSVYSPDNKLSVLREIKEEKCNKYVSGAWIRLNETECLLICSESFPIHSELDHLTDRCVFDLAFTSDDIYSEPALFLSHPW